MAIEVETFPSGFLTLTQGSRVTGLSTATLRNYFDSGKVGGTVSPSGERFLKAEDIQRLANELRRRGGGRS